MKTEPIVAASIGLDADGVPFSPEYGDIYHPKSGALPQARHVFLAGNGLPGRWQGRDQFTILETGFGLGNNFLATWAAWRDDPQRCTRLTVVSVERHPPSRDVLAALPRDPTLAELARLLVAAWPPLTPNLHRLSFDDGRVELLLAFGDVQAWLPELTLSADAFYLDGFAPAHNPRMWDGRVCKALARLAFPGATLSTWTAAQAVRAELTTAGFAVGLAPGAGGKRDITIGRYAPVFTPRGPAGRSRVPGSTSRRALIVGAGLAGTATAWALAERGWSSVVIERHGRLAAEASGNPGGIFHGTLHPQDGPHARLHRAGALAAAQAVRVAIDAHGAAGAVRGLLRLETSATLAQMAGRLATLGLPDDYVQALDADAASRLAAVRLAGPAWHYPGGGWVEPAGLARTFVERGGDRVELRLDARVDRLRRADGHWQVLGATGRVVEEAETLVLANAGDALRLLDQPAWPLEPVRGQISVLPHQDVPAGLRHCARPVTGAGYLLPITSGGIMFGATRQFGDLDPEVRGADHAINLAQLGKLAPGATEIDPRLLTGRTAWRWVAADRLPLIGAAPVRSLWPGLTVPMPGWEQPRRVPREPGLFVFIGLGSRGIGWSALGAQLLAATIAGTPLPLEAGLADAVDPARFVSRAQRRSVLSAGADVAPPPCSSLSGGGGTPDAGGRDEFVPPG